MAATRAAKNPANFIKEPRSNRRGDHTTGCGIDQGVVGQVAVIQDSADRPLLKSCRGRERAAGAGAMTASRYVLAIDQGTTSTRAMLFDAQGQVRQTAR